MKTSLRRPFILCALLMAGLSLVPAGRLWGQTFTNGTFDNFNNHAAIPAGSGAVLNLGDTWLTGWTVGGPGGGNISVNGPSTVATPYAGQDYIRFDQGNTANGGSLSQTFTTVIGQSYTVSFAVGQTGPGSMSLTATAVSLNNSVLASHYCVPTPSTVIVWTLFYLNFTATTTNTTLVFLDSSTQTIAVDIALSGVTVTAVGASASVQFTASPISGVAPLAVNFTSPAVDSQGNSITSRNWAFGDGATSTAQSPSHTYTVPGTYSPTLQVTNSSGTAIAATGPSITVQPGAIRNLPGFRLHSLAGNDDGSTVAEPIGFTINFYGSNFTSLYVNNNGNVTFGTPLSTFTPYGLTNTLSEIIAPFFADVDTQLGNVVTFGNDIVDGHPAFGVDWIGVGYFSVHTNKLNSFQVVLIDRSDRDPGDFDIEFNYNQIQWETGDASSGVNGLGGNSAVVGFSNGSDLPGTSLQLQGSFINGELLDSNPGGLIHGDLNTNVLGRYIFPIVNLTNKVLNVPLLSQGNPLWSNNIYGGSPCTIQAQGSALCCMAMALNYEGIATDPAALNTLMNNDNDFVGASVNWDAATRDASADTLEFHAYRTSYLQYLSQILADNYPVIVGVNLNAAGVPTHYVLVTGYHNGQYLINDPGDANATTLAYYTNNFETRGYVAAEAGDVSGLDLTSGNAASILVVDPLGRRTGFEPSSGRVLQEIPQSVHFLDTLVNNNLTCASGPDTAHQVEIPQPMLGIYQIYLSGSNAGTYQLGLRSFSQTGTSASPLTLSGSRTPNTLNEFQVIVSSAGVASQPFTNEYAWSVAPPPPIASFPAAEQFTAPGVDTAGNAVTSNWNWNFGDGATSTAQSPSHTYTISGAYYPSLIALDSAGVTVVSYCPPIAPPVVVAPTNLAFTATPTTGVEPLTVTFSFLSAGNITNGIATWNWTYGDGTTANTQNLSHTYAGSGTFFPTLVATNANGAQIIAFGPVITVYPALISYKATPVIGAAPLTVQFSPDSVDESGNAITSWTWTFDDNTTSTEQSPTHIYTAAGTYSPRLVVANSVGATIAGYGPKTITATNAELYAGLVENGGFETGDLTAWTYSGAATNAIDIFVDNGSQSDITPNSGNYLAAFCPMGSLGYLSQTLATSAGTPYLLSLWLNSPDGQIPNEFLVAWNGTTLFDATNIPAIGWTNLQFWVSATGTSTVLEFGGRADAYGSFLGLDDVGVVPTRPGIGGFNVSGANLVFSGVNGLSGGTYNLLMSTNLTLPLSQWVNVGGTVLSTNGNFTITINKPSTSGATQRYYIVQFQ